MVFNLLFRYAADSASGGTAPPTLPDSASGGTAPPTLPDSASGGTAPPALPDSASGGTAPAGTSAVPGLQRFLIRFQRMALLRRKALRYFYAYGYIFIAAFAA